MLWSSYRGFQNKTRIKAFVKVVLALLYKRMSKERRKGNPPTPTTLSLYTICSPPPNHSSCSNIPSESHPMILHTTNKTSYQHNQAISPDVATPQTTSLSWQIIPPPSHCFLRVFQRLHLSITQFLPHHPNLSILSSKYLHVFLDHNRMRRRIAEWGPFSETNFTFCWWMNLT